MKSEGEIDFTVWDDELEHVPLVQRKNMLAIEKVHSGCNPKVVLLENGSEKSMFCNNHIVKKENEGCDSQGALSVISPCYFGESINLQLEQETQQIPVNGFCAQSIESLGRTQINMPTCSKENTGSSFCTVSQYSRPSVIPNRVKPEGSDNMISLLAEDTSVSGFTGIKCKYSDAIADDFNEDLDHIVLKRRQQMLQLREVSDLGKQTSLDNGKKFHEGLIQCCQSIEKEDTNGVNNEERLAAKNQLPGTLERSAFSLGTSAIQCSSSKELIHKCFVSTNNFCSKSIKPVDNIETEEVERTYSFQKVGMDLGSYGGRAHLPAVENNELNSTSSNMKVKFEPCDHGDLNNLDPKAADTISQNIMPVKTERIIPYQHFENNIETVPLKDRIKLLGSIKNTSGISRNNVLSNKLPSPSNSNFCDSESAGQPKTGRPRKRKKTATDSVKIALEEDAPGLLQVLLDKGILVDEIKLYGETESDEALDEYLCEESFSELEAVMSKMCGKTTHFQYGSVTYSLSWIFFQPESFIKFPSQRTQKASRASYCLACLLSLVEQSKYLQFREWPVEWGWCRDLQSFIFVFERHNRIVLERPEYGYATYFFEHVNSLPVNWQIKRLVTAMKLTSCSRISLLENKALVVGEDLSEGEAKVLIEFGWVPNTGLGTMLNYRDRVIHDRKEDSSDWSSKIGKLLVDGYKGGHLVQPNIPKKAEEYLGDQTTLVKVETD